MDTKTLPQLTVVVNITIPPKADYRVCSLVLDTIRVGFPTAKVIVYDNANDDITSHDLFERVRTAKATMVTYVTRQHHALWIGNMVNEHKGRLVILDGDVMFWKSCEEFEFSTLLAGYYVPTMYNEFSQCISFERLHTSFLWISDTTALLDQVVRTYPLSYQPFGEYCPLDPFTPSVKFVRGQPMFWDSTSVLYNIVGGTAFDSDVLECYDHVNSATFYDVMYERMEQKEMFALLHKMAKEDPTQLKGRHIGATAYYKVMAEKAKQMEEERMKIQKV